MSEKTNRQPSPLCEICRCGAAVMTAGEGGFITCRHLVEKTPNLAIARAPRPDPELATCGDFDPMLAGIA